jgi:hypothetical protein
MAQDPAQASSKRSLSTYSMNMNKQCKFSSRVVFLVAGIYGVVVLLPNTFWRGSSPGIFRRRSRIRNISMVSSAWLSPGS